MVNNFLDFSKTLKKKNVKDFSRPENNHFKFVMTFLGFPWPYEAWDSVIILASLCTKSALK